MVGLLAVLAIVAYLMISSLGAGASSTGSGGGLGAYQGAINAAKASVASQDAAARSTTTP